MSVNCSMHVGWLSNTVSLFYPLFPLLSQAVPFATHIYNYSLPVIATNLAHGSQMRFSPVCSCHDVSLYLKKQNLR
ncbi:hypothetical protein GGR58DRAFT_475836 [Xylaria digitata]|nr:hypothetical protein GGR58DRAFT_475836 [Xylaria digitata]